MWASMACTGIACFIYGLFENRDSSVGIATGWRVGIRFPAETRFVSSPQRPDRLWGPTQPPATIEQRNYATRLQQFGYC
jgi:hypothetical protein